MSASYNMLSSLEDLPVRPLNNYIDGLTLAQADVFGVFLDITGAFDNVEWFPVMARLESLGASLRTLTLIRNYLEGHTALLTLENSSYQRLLGGDCPQGSQLGPTQWKIAMSDLEEIVVENKTSMVLDADDIALLVGAVRSHTAFIKILN